MRAIGVISNGGRRSDDCEQIDSIRRFETFNYGGGQESDAIKREPGGLVV